MPAVDPDGYPSHVVSGELVESAWGNAVVDNLHRIGDQANANTTLATAAPLGVLAAARGSTSDFGPVGNVPNAVPGYTVTVPVVAGRWYRTTAWLTVTQSSGPGNATVGIADAANTGQRGVSLTLPLNAVATIPISETFLAGTTGSITRKVMLSTSSGGIAYFGTLGRNGDIVIEDLGLN